MKLRFIKIDRERVPQARYACLEPAPFCRAPRMGGWKGTRRRTVSLRIDEAKLHSSRSALAYT